MAPFRSDVNMSVVSARTAGRRSRCMVAYFEIGFPCRDARRGDSPRIYVP